MKAILENRNILRFYCYYYKYLALLTSRMEDLIMKVSHSNGSNIVTLNNPYNGGIQGFLK